MKKVPFSIEFVSTFTEGDKYSNIPDEVLTQVCKEGLVELLQARMDEINKGATKIVVEMVKS